jgi:hypothetical protein
MSQSQYVIIDLKSGLKCEGTLANIDKVNLKINLLNAKRYTKDENGDLKEENFEALEINKEDIKEIKLVQFEPKEEKKNLNAIPESKAQSIREKAKKYNKEESFFDDLSPMTNMEAKNESIKYNDKNCDTFNLPQNSSELRDNNNRGRRGGNRGGYNNNRGNRGGGMKRNYNNYSNYNSNYNNNNSNYSQGGFNPNYNQGGYNNRGGRRGGNRGGYNQGGHREGGYNQGAYNQGGYNQGGYNQNQNQDRFNPNQERFNPGFNPGFNQNQGYSQFTANQNQPNANANSNPNSNATPTNNQFPQNANFNNLTPYNPGEGAKERSIYDQF